MVNGFNIGEGIGYAFYAVCIMLDSFIYGLINGMFKVFMSLASAQILTSDAYASIANKIYMIIGVVMLFVLAYGLLRSVIDPEKGKNGDLSGSKVLKSLVIAVVGLAVTPVIFNLLYKGQEVFLRNDVIAAIFFRSDTAVEHFDDIQFTNDVSNSNSGSATNASSAPITVPIGDVEYNKQVKNLGGAVTATYLWEAFFRPNPAVFGDDYATSSQNIKGDYTKLFTERVNSAAVICGIGAAILVILGIAGAGFTFGTSLAITAAGTAVGAGTCAGIAAIQNGNLLTKDNLTLAAAYNYSASTGDFSVYQAFIPNILDGDGEILYTWFVTALVGIFVVYCFLTFSIDLAVRAAKLAYYQLIAPIPLILQIVPKFKDTFNKYVHSVVSTFLEVFIRISVVYIIVYFISHLSDLFSFDLNASGVDLNWGERLLAQVILILGLIAFARMAPKLIGETFGLKSGSLDFGIRNKLADGGLFSAGALAGSAITGGIRNWRNTWKDSKKDNPDIGFGRRAFQSARSAIGGSGSALVRSGYNQFFAPNHHEAHSIQEMRDAASRAAENASNARVRRRGRHSDIDGEALRRSGDAAYKEVHDQTYATEIANGKSTEEAERLAKEAGNVARQRVIDSGESRLRDRIAASADVRTRNLHDSYTAWSLGTIDTSFMDGYVKLQSDLTGLQGKLEETYFKDNQIREYEDTLNNLKNMSVKDFAYSEAVKERANKVLDAEIPDLIEKMVGPKQANETDADYDARLQSFLNSTQLRPWEESLKERYNHIKNKEYDKIQDLPDLDCVGYKELQESIKTDRTSADYMSFNDFSIDPNSEEFTKAMDQRNKAISRANKEFLDAKENYVSKKLAEYSISGVHNDVSRAFSEFFVSHQNEMHKYENEMFLDGKTLTQYMSSTFGDSIMQDGHANAATLFANSADSNFNYDFTFKFTDANGSHNNCQIVFDGSSNQFEIKDENGSVVQQNLDFGKLQDYVKGLKDFKITETTYDKINKLKAGNVPGTTSKLKSDARTARDRFMDTDAYRDAQTRKQRERERQQNNNR